MSTAILHYRTLRQRLSLPVKEGAVVTALQEVVWTSAEPKRRELVRSLFVEGAAADHGRSHSAGWKFPVPDEAFKTIDNVLGEFREAVKGWKANPLDIPLEKELWVDALPWLRFGYLAKAQGRQHHAYLEFTRDAGKRRSLLADLPALDQLRRILMG